MKGMENMKKTLFSLLVVISMLFSLTVYSGVYAEDVYTVTADANGKVLFEFEKADRTGGTCKTPDAPDGTQYLQQNANGTTANVQVTGSAVLPSEGYYKVTYLIGYKVGSNNTVRKKTSTVTLTMGSYSYDNVSKEFEQNYESSYYTGASGTCLMARYEKTLWFDAGEVPITLDVANAETGDLLQFQADYIEFEPLTNPIFDFSDYRDGGKVAGTKAGNKYMYYGASASTTNAYVNIPITITETGNYKVTYLVSVADDNNSQINLSLIPDGGTAKKFGDNTQEGTEPEFTYGTTYGHVYQYEAEVENISAGSYTIQAEIVPTEGGKLSCYLDSIEFALQGGGGEITEPENSFDKTSDTAKVYYNAPIIGKAVLALYSGNELVALSAWTDMNNTDEVELTATTSKAYDTAKVFVWDGIDTMKPVVGAVVFENLNQ